MDEIVVDFQSESKELASQLIEILESIESDPTQFKRLNEYGNMVDRIMGAAKSIEKMVPELAERLGLIGKYSELCKIVSYKCSQVPNNPSLITITVALLLDATEMLEKMIEGLVTKQKLDMSAYLSETFLGRLHWCDTQFKAGLSGTIGTTVTPPQTEIDDLLKSLGVV